MSAGRAPEGVITKRAVAEAFDVSPRTISRWAEDRALDFPRSVVIRKRRYFRRHEIDAWKASRASADGAAVDTAKARRAASAKRREDAREYGLVCSNRRARQP